MDSLYGEDMVRKIFIVGHRGVPSLAPENTLPSFIKAIEYNIDFIELDLHFTRDKRIIVMHDFSVDRTTNGSGRISELSFDEIRKLDAGGWFSSRYKGVKVPEFEEVLNIAAGKIGLIIHIKEEGLEKPVVDLLEKYNIVNDSIVLSYPWNIIRKVRELNPYITTIADLPNPTREELFKAISFHPNLVSIHKDKLDKRFVRLCHRRGILVNTWPINTIKDLEKSIKYEVDFITSDFPHIMLNNMPEFDINYNTRESD